jgi:hypothetical protein
MKAAVMRKLLEHFAQMREEAGDDKIGKGLRTLANLLPQRGQKEVRDFLAEVERARSKRA